jgi:hypothetical protein
MNSYRHIIIGITAILTGATVLEAADELLQDRVLDYPTGYREGFTEYFRGDRIFEHDQVIRIYANDVALGGAKLNGKLPNGSVLVAELYEAVEDEDGEVVESAIGRRISGPMKAIAVMERQAGWDDQYPEELKVGDWEFDLFSTAGENLNKDMTACRACHNPLSDSEFVFSLEHVIAAQP